MPMLQFNKMSLVFREVFQDYSSGMKENQKSSDYLFKTDSQNEDNPLLYSFDNVRPKSRAKTCLSGTDLQRVILVEKSPTVFSPAKTPVPPGSSKDESLGQTSQSLTSTKTSSHISPNTQLTDVHGVNAIHAKKAKKSRKRSNCSSKTKKGKHSQPTITSTGLPPYNDKVTPVPAITTNGQLTKPSRVSSEPPSKISAQFILSYPLSVDQGQHSHNQSVFTTDIHQQQHSLSRSLNSSAKSSAVCSKDETLTNGYSGTDSNTLTQTDSESLVANGSSVVIYKLDLAHRVKSASIQKSRHTTQSENIRDKENYVTNSKDLSLNVIPCAIQSDIKSKNHTDKTLNKRNSDLSSLDEANDHKFSVLASIYGAVYDTANKITAQVDSLKKVKKVYQSERQSGTLKENGMEFPCAPPATPTPDVLKNHEFIPSMSDIRSQRLVKGRLQNMEKEAQKKLEKKKLANTKMEKQQVKDKEKLAKLLQRREIYALNKVMTELENKRFLDFCRTKGLNPS